MAAPVWHQYMTAAHTTMDIPQVPGLPLHPRQIEERQRLAEMRRDDPGLGTGGREPAKRMPARTRKMLTSLAKLLREAPKLQGAVGSNKGAALDKPAARAQ